VELAEGRGNALEGVPPTTAANFTKSRTGDAQERDFRPRPLLEEMGFADFETEE
jgi:hypothetical protein